MIDRIPDGPKTLFQPSILGLLMCKFSGIFDYLGTDFLQVTRRVLNGCIANCENKVTYKFRGRSITIRETLWISWLIAPGLALPINPALAQTAEDTVQILDNSTSIVGVTEGLGTTHGYTVHISLCFS